MDIADVPKTFPDTKVKGMHTCKKNPVFAVFLKYPMGYFGLYGSSNWQNNLISHFLANTSWTSAFRPTHPNAVFWAGATLWCHTTQPYSLIPFMLTEMGRFCYHKGGSPHSFECPLNIESTWLSEQAWVNMVLITPIQAISMNVADWEGLHIHRYLVKLHPSPVTLFLTHWGRIIEI